MKTLNRNSANIKKELPLRIMQFGGGNFLRAFVDWMVQILNERTDFNGGVVVIKPTEGGDYKDLKQQEGMFHVLLDGIKKEKFVSENKLVSSIQKAVNPYKEWTTYLDLATLEDIRFIISNTTESGIRFSEEDSKEDAPPKEFPAKLTLWLLKRFEHFNGDVSKGCILLPCELIEKNGEILKDCILKYSEHWGLNDDFKNWIHNSNYFCNTLVDRIVSGYPTDRAKRIETKIGFMDRLLVAGEQYHSWIIQGPDFVSAEVPFHLTDLNVSFVNNLTLHREMKVRILNGAHTAMVPVAYLMGIRLVSEAMEDEWVGDFIESLLLEETIATLAFPEEKKTNYVKDVLNRFRNPSLQHALLSISLNSTSKFVTRLLPTLKDYKRIHGILPNKIVFGFTCLLLFYRGEFRGEKIPLRDDQNVLDFFTQVWQQFDADQLNVHQLVSTILGESSIWKEDLNQILGLTDKVSEYIESIENKGIINALKN